MLYKNKKINFYNVKISSKNLIKNDDEKISDSLIKHLKLINNFSNYLKKNGIKSIKF